MIPESPFKLSRRLALALSIGAAARGSSQSVTQPAAELPPIDMHDMPRQLHTSAADLGTLYDDVHKLAAEDSYSLSFLSASYSDWREFQVAARDKIHELMSIRSAAIAPQPELVERVDCGSYIREKIIFSTSPHFRVPAYVLIPKTLKGRAPAIVDLHSHGGMFLFGKEKVIDLGRNHPAMNTYHERNYDGCPTATMLVQHGFVVISIDAFGFGERRILLDVDIPRGWDRSRYSLDDVQHLNQQCRSKESTIAKALVFAGASWPGIVSSDDMRTVDYLVTRPEVDPDRIGCLGISMGGYRSTYLAALDDRIKATCITGFMSSVKPMIQAHIDTHSWVHFLPGLHQFLDLPDVASLAAPRALLVQQCSQDRLFTLSGMQAAVQSISQVYTKVGAAEKFSGRFYDAPHQFTRRMQAEALAWMQQHLA